MDLSTCAIKRDCRPVGFARKLKMRRENPAGDGGGVIVFGRVLSGGRPIAQQTSAWQTDGRAPFYRRPRNYVESLTLSSFAYRPRFCHVFQRPVRRPFASPAGVSAEWRTFVKKKYPDFEAGSYNQTRRTTGTSNMSGCRFFGNHNECSYRI